MTGGDSRVLAPLDLLLGCSSGKLRLLSLEDVLSLSFSWIAECLSSMSLAFPGDLLSSIRYSCGLAISRDVLGLLYLPPSLVRGL
eukprot:766409-Hanusia_phi.AAC.4